MTAHRRTRLRCVLAAVAAVGLLPAAAGAAPARQPNAPTSTGQPGWPGWPGLLDPAKSPGYHVLNGVAEESPGDVLAAGVGGPPGGQGRVWAWDGQSWSSTRAPCPDGCGLTAITRIGPGDAWAVGADHDGALPVALHYDGHQWTRATLPTPAPDSADRPMAVSASGPDDVWAAGYTVTGEELDLSPLIEHYDGHTWTKVHSPSPKQGAYLTTIVSAGPDDAWAAGVSLERLIEHWDGHRWTRVRTGLPRTRLYFHGLAALGPDDVWAVGLRYRPPHGSGDTRWPGGDVTAVFHWDGTRWHHIRSPNTNRTGNQLLAVAVRSDHDIWAVGGSGSFHSATTSHTLTEHYDGHRWSIVRSPDPGRATNVLNGVTMGPDGDAWAVGQASSDHNVHYRDLALHFDGHRWVNQPVRPNRGQPAS